MTDYADLEGAAEIVRIAAGFDWTWMKSDVPKLCRATGWRVVDNVDKIIILETNLDQA